MCKIEQGGTYIIKGRKASNAREYHKIKVVENLLGTYYIKNLDSGGSYRTGEKSFHYMWDIVGECSQSADNIHDLVYDKVTSMHIGELTKDEAISEICDLIKGGVCH